MAAEPTVVAQYGHRIGENPLWHTDEERLYWCGIYEGGLYRYDPAADRHEQVYDGERIGGFTFQADGAVLLFQDEGAVRVWRDGTGISETVVAPGAVHEQRFNDVIADPCGRVFCGTYSPAGEQTAALYRLDTDGSLTRLLADRDLSNGLGFSLDRETLYYTESRAGRIHEFEYDEGAGDLENRRTFRDVDPETGIPDGLTVDATGDIWSAMSGGGCVVRYAPDGTERERLTIPTERVTSLAFGGSDRTDLYVTSGGGEDVETFGRHAGALFECQPGVAGRREFVSRVGLD